MKSLNLIAPNPVLNIINLQYILLQLYLLCYTIGINTWAKEDAHMEDKTLLTKACPLVSELNQTI